MPVIRIILFSLLLLSSVRAYAQATLDEDRINSWASNWANISQCEQAGFTPAGRMQEMRSVMQQNLSDQVVQQLNAKFQYAMSEKLIYVRRVQRWVPMTITKEFCAGYGR